MLSDLVKALQIMNKYGNPDYPTHCSHDKLLVCIDPADVSKEKTSKYVMFDPTPDFNSKSILIPITIGSGYKMRVVSAGDFSLYGYYKVEYDLQDKKGWRDFEHVRECGYSAVISTFLHKSYKGLVHMINTKYNTKAKLMKFITGLPEACERKNQYLREKERQADMERWAKKRRDVERGIDRW